MTRLCLNMIVKNESAIITRLFDSVSALIDCYCICDTGSTDNTIEVIKEYFLKKNIPGKVVHEDFVNFEHNRNFALRACDNMDTDYILLLDADMILNITPNFNIQKFKAELPNHMAHYIFQGNQYHHYKNVRIVKNSPDVSYWGVTHEYVQLPSNVTYGCGDPKDIFINDVGDGGSKTNKFLRDIELLSKALESNPNNDRYTFYLANSYKDSGQPTQAIKFYEKRIQIGGWFEEIWQSHYRIGMCYEEMGNMAQALFWWYKAFEIHPQRIENLYRIISYYRQQGQNQLAYELFHVADLRRGTIQSLDFLFVEKDVYEYKLDYELSIISYYVNHYNYNIVKCCMNLFSYLHLDDWMFRNILSNYKFYSTTIGGTNLKIDLPKVEDGFNSSTPSLVFHKNELILNTRFVNYYIDDNGGYNNGDFIETINVLTKYNCLDLSNIEMVEGNQHVLQYNKEHDNRYVGLEDVRLFSHKDKLYFNANRGFENKFCIEHGIVEDSYITNSQLLSCDHSDNPIQKNWVLFEDGKGDMKCIYGWYPLTIGNIVDNHFVQTYQGPNMNVFKYLRGSTNGVTVNDEIWFIGHIVSYEDRRYYYHCLIALDKNTYNVTRYTPFFTFEKEKVEYTLGFVCKDDHLVIGYSTMDKTTQFRSVSLESIYRMFQILGFPQHI